ncbi:uncharacterized protein LOC101457654 [Ceratitis capitata]|uniref:uncharacterized protein LOC101457654 n=1 Tax=Ceratitis capitata TaxID=7213 RepID=UPI000329E1F8|nr:uncharacterized protein LOC101457654 [Ceratitis capitata]
MTDSEMSVSGGPLDLSDSNSSSSVGVSSSTSYTSDSEDLQLDTLEQAKINNEVLRLPRGLCENDKIFDEFFSVETWNDLPEAMRIRLDQYLPNFSNLLTHQEVDLEKQRTLLMLFNGELRRFGRSPLIDLQHGLEDGNFRPDILHLRQNIAKSRRREHRFQRCEHLSRLARELFLSRERLLRMAYKSPANVVLRTERNTKREQNTLNADTKLCTVRCRKRLRNEMNHITEQIGVKMGELSADEDESSSAQIADDYHFNKQSDITTSLKTPVPSTDRFIFSTLFKRRIDLTDEEAVRADQFMQQSRLSNRNFRTYIREHKRRKLTEPNLPDFETSDIRLRDVWARAQMGSNFKQLFGSGKMMGRKPKSKYISNSEPPALVPIQAKENSSDNTRKIVTNKPEIKLNTQFIGSSSKPAKDRQVEHFQQHLEEQSNGSIQHPFLPEDGAPFNILDGEVELQQEEVETYRNCEETLPRFVISNEVVLPAIEQSDVPPQKLLQTPHKEEIMSIDSKTKINLGEDKEHGSLKEQSIPKLEPIFNKIGRTPVREKVRSNPQINYISNNASNGSAAIITPVKKQASTSKTVSPANLFDSSELIQETHACFFSLIRDLFCATPHHRMQYNELRLRIDMWLRNPITALNDWYSQADNWSGLLMSAINFLAGDFSDQPDEYVPYIEFKPQQNIFQWIGAGRDSDARLLTLCNFWLQRRCETSDRKTTAIHTVSEPVNDEANEPSAISNTRHHSSEIEEPTVSYDGGVSPPPPPPPRCPTSWTVCAATPEEVVEFQRQERERFDQPHRAYTYRMHGYESVVGPVKGIYTQMYALTKARGHSMMIGNRPNFVTILTLVRDATARLPNGEGTRADIAELLKSSQYINLKEGENVLQTTVSGALDRMHTEHDPCVRYDPKRKIWIYLHRNRSEDDFERIHQQSQGIGKSKKVAHRKPKAKTAISKGSSEIAESNCAVTTFDEEANVEGINIVTNTPKVNAAFSMPALVPSNPIIVSSQSAITQQKMQLAMSKPSANRSLPVPPLKYNIPHQQQKSLLKSTVQSQPLKQQEPRQINNSVGIDNQQSQRIQQRVAILAKNTTISEVVTDESKTLKQFSLTMSPNKNNLSAFATSAGGSSTPIIVATPSGLQTVHVSNTTVVAQPAGTTVSMASQHSSPIGTAFGGKQVALNKPILINQIRSQPTVDAASKAKATSQQILKQQNTVYPQLQQRQAQNFIIPISMASSVSNSGIVENQSVVPKESNVRTMPVASSISSDGTTTIYMDNSQLVSNVGNLSQEQGQQKQTQAKNIIRLVPSIASTGVKTILQTSTGGSMITSRKPPVHVIGQRVVSAGSGTGTVRAQVQQAKTIGNLSLMSSSGGTQTCGISTVVSAPSGSTLIKMSPHTFATLQQKQGQHIVVKQSPSSSPATSQQQRIIEKTTLLKNNSIVSQTGGIAAQTVGKKVFMQHPPSTAVQKAIVSAASSVGSQTATTPITTLNDKVHTINATNLTSQQQRVLLQNIKQQQKQNIQLKTLQVVSGSPTTSQAQSQVQQVVSRAQTLTMLPSLASGAATAGQQHNSKPIAVMVSQTQGLSRVLKAGSTNTQSQSQQQMITIANNDSPTAETAGGTRILTTSSGQIISLESLLQKQSGSGLLKVNPSSSAGTIVKNLQTTNILSQQQQPQLMTSTGNATTYTVVSQPKSSNTHRVTTAQSSESLNVVSGGAGRILVSPGGQLTTPQIARVLGKAGVATNSLASSSVGGNNIRVIKNASSVGSAGNSFNIANFQGKQVVFATKPTTTVSKNLGNVQSHQIHTAGMVIGGQALKLQRAQQQNKVANSSSASVVASPSGTQMQTVIMGNQILRVQQMPTTVKTTGSNGSSMQQRVGTASVGNLVSGTNTSGSLIVNNSSEAGTSATTMNLPKTVVLGTSGQTIRLQPSQQSVQATHHQATSAQMQTQPQAQVVTVKNTPPQGMKTSNVGRVVLAVQGGGQIFLSPNFQGNTLNLKSLQNMKVVSLTSRAAVNTSNQAKEKPTGIQPSSGSSNS